MRELHPGHSVSMALNVYHHCGFFLRPLIVIVDASGHHLGGVLTDMNSSGLICTVQAGHRFPSFCPTPSRDNHLFRTIPVQSSIINLIFEASVPLHPPN